MKKNVLSPIGGPFQTTSIYSPLRYRKSMEFLHVLLAERSIEKKVQRLCEICWNLPRAHPARTSVRIGQVENSNQYPSQPSK